VAIFTVAAGTAGFTVFAGGAMSMGGGTSNTAAGVGFTGSTRFAGTGGSGKFACGNGRSASGGTSILAGGFGVETTVEGTLGVGINTGVSGRAVTGFTSVGGAIGFKGGTSRAGSGSGRTTASLGVGFGLVAGATGKVGLPVLSVLPAWEGRKLKSGCSTGSGGVKFAEFTGGAGGAMVAGFDGTLGIGVGTLGGTGFGSLMPHVGVCGSFTTGFGAGTGFGVESTGSGVSSDGTGGTSFRVPPTGWIRDGEGKLGVYDGVLG
jgi:hypothetical protein